jgi:hypothetical protein
MRSSTGPPGAPGGEQQRLTPAKVKNHNQISQFSGKT